MTPILSGLDASSSDAELVGACLAGIDGARRHAAEALRAAAPPAASFPVSNARACGLMNLAVSSYHYSPHPSENLCRSIIVCGLILVLRGI